MLNSAEHKISTANSQNLLIFQVQITKSSINVKMPTIVGILTFIAELSIMRKKSFKTSGPGLVDCRDYSSLGL